MFRCLLTPTASLWICEGFIPFPTRSPGGEKTSSIPSLKRVRYRKIAWQYKMRGPRKLASSTDKPTPGFVGSPASFSTSNACECPHTVRLARRVTALPAWTPLPCTAMFHFTLGLFHTRPTQFIHARSYSRTSVLSLVLPLHLKWRGWQVQKQLVSRESNMGCILFSNQDVTCKSYIPN